MLTVPKKTKAKLSISYSGVPKSISVNGDFSVGINKDYISLKKNCEVAPVVCIEKSNMSVEGTIKVDSKFTVITSGYKNREISKEDGFTEWSFSIH
ncbi:MAG: hypothetical protein E7214_06260 [Clostridium sp.]|nr:hypothetical protein [Clostridium sp.]